MRKDKRKLSQPVELLLGKKANEVTEAELAQEGYRALHVRMSGNPRLDWILGLVMEEATKPEEFADVMSDLANVLSSAFAFVAIRELKSEKGAPSDEEIEAQALAHVASWSGIIEDLVKRERTDRALMMAGQQSVQ